MSIDYFKALYIKNMYISAGKTIMDKLFKTNMQFINYRELNRYYESFYLCDRDLRINIQDNYFAFFHTLCIMLCDHIYCEDEVYFILSPFHITDVIYQMIVPIKNVVITNTTTPSSRKANNLYTTISHHKNTEYLSYAMDYFKKSEKIQQE